MSVLAQRSFVGFGLGPIQTGLFLLESLRSGNFSRWTVAEIDPDLVAATRSAGGRLAVNVAGRDGITTVELPDVELLNPRVPEDRERLVQTVAEADELATALPSVDTYFLGGESSAGAILRDAFRQNPGHRRVVYTAENNNRAAEILRDGLSRAGTPLENTALLNTVIGKMSGWVTDPAVIRRLGLAPFTARHSGALLVEAFNRIQVSQVGWTDFQRGIPQFEEKPDLVPFEEAKLYGHNAVHALLGYLGWQRGHATMADVGNDSDLLEVGRRAFLDESRPAVLHRNRTVADPLFTPAGYEAYATDLLERMVSPWLHDRISRVVRDPIRKLGPDDRLIGTMRHALAAGVAPRHLARGAATAIRYMMRRPESLSRPLKSLEACEHRWNAASVAALLRELCGETPLPEETSLAEQIAENAA